MLVSTRGRYALRILTDLAEHHNGDFIPMKEVAERQGISLKYIERIIPDLKKAGFIDSSHGKGGGYRLNRQPDEYNIWEILLVSEGNMAPVACLTPGADPCARACECRTLDLWSGYYQVTKQYFSQKTIADLMQNNGADNYVI